jgi:hypothetical protein
MWGFWQISLREVEQSENPKHLKKQTFSLVIQIFLSNENFGIKQCSSYKGNNSNF